jgi:hypothetical protein
MEEYTNYKHKILSSYMFIKQKEVCLVLTTNTYIVKSNREENDYQE